jgi:hypothetical protein
MTQPSLEFGRRAQLQAGRDTSLEYFGGEGIQIEPDVTHNQRWH